MILDVRKDNSVCASQGQFLATAKRAVCDDGVEGWSVHAWIGDRQMVSAWCDLDWFEAERVCKRLIRWLADKYGGRKMTAREKGKCAICGKAFVQSGNGLKKYCSRLCYRKANRGDRQGASLERTCAICGKVFVASRTGRKKYCSHECAAAGAKQRSYENGHYKKGARRRCGSLKSLSRPKTYAEIRAANRAHPVVAGWRGQAVAGGCAASLAAMKAVAK